MNLGRRTQPQPFAIYCDEPDNKSCYESTGGYISALNDAAQRHHHDDGIRADSPLEGMERVQDMKGTKDVNGIGVMESGTVIDEDISYSEQEEDYSPRVHRNITATSVSSLPTSAQSSEGEGRYSPSKSPRISIRTCSTRGPQMPSQISERLSPRKTFRATSPRKYANARLGPRPRIRERQDERDTAYSPLVLLHVTILPLILPWSQDTMKKAMPKRVRDRLAVLRGHISDMVLQRGLLVPHPQEDFDDLEEKVLEALDLNNSFLNSCQSLESGDADEEWAGPASNEEEGTDYCQTCGDENCFTKSIHNKWEVRVYASNGMLRAGAWATAWAEMERVDVEILPRISHVLRERLDEVQSKEDGIHKESVPSRNAADVDSAHTRRHSKEANEVPLDESPAPQPLSPAQSETRGTQAPRARKATRNSATDDKLPAAYNAKDVPLRVLLANYIYLLAQDRRNIAILFLLITVIFSTMQGMGALNPSLHLEPNVGTGNLTQSFLSPMAVETDMSWSTAVVATSPQMDDEVNMSTAAEVVKIEVGSGAVSDIALEADDEMGLSTDSVVNQVNPLGMAKEVRHDSVVVDAVAINEALAVMNVGRDVLATSIENGPRFAAPSKADARLEVTAVTSSGVCLVEPSIMEKVCWQKSDKPV